MSLNTTNLGRQAQTEVLYAEEVRTTNLASANAIIANDIISVSYAYQNAITQGSIASPVSVSTAIPYTNTIYKYNSFYNITATSGTTWNFVCNLLSGLPPNFLSVFTPVVSVVFANSSLDPSSIITHLHFTTSGGGTYDLNLLLDSSAAVTYTAPLVMKVTILIYPD